MESITRRKENNDYPERKVEGSQVGTKENKSRSDYNINKIFIIKEIDTVSNTIVEFEYI